MYSSLVEITQNREFLASVRKGWSYGSNLTLLSSLPSYHECLESQTKNDIEFTKIFSEPLGYYLIKCFLVLNCNDDKAVFVSDVKLYKSLTDPSARLHISKKIYLKYCHPPSNLHNHHNTFPRGVSVFETNPHKQKNKNTPLTHIHNTNPNFYDSDENKSIDSSLQAQVQVQGYNKYFQLSSESHTQQREREKIKNLHKNALDIYGDVIDICHIRINNHSIRDDIFDDILSLVLRDLELNIFPLFIKHALYKLYIQCMCYIQQQSKLTIDSFVTLRVLGRGAFGFVNAVIKKNTGYIYAMKCINKKRVMATDSVETIMSERNFLALMNSNFVTGLKYAVMDGNTLYLIIDLMVGGDLKFHLNKEGRFNIEKSRFYAASVLLGLQHIHSKGIVYRDIKLENVLLDSGGNCKISDLGLAVKSVKKVRGYAGTPGYTAPEVCLQQSYHKKADFFSFGVMIYRFLSGRKPFQIKSKHKQAKKSGGGGADDARKADAKGKNGPRGHRTGNELDKNVVEIEPEYPDRYFTPSARSLLKGLMCKNPKFRLSNINEIKAHPWFANKIDFGLLESGNLVPNFVPNQDEINADSLRHIGRPPNDDKYKDVKVTKDFQKSLSKFPFSSNQQQQYEIIDVLKKIKEYYSFKKFINIISKQTGHDTNDIIHKLTAIPSDNEINKFAQNIRNSKEKYGLNAFIPQYYSLKNRNKHIQNGIGRDKSDIITSNSESGGSSIGHHYDSVHSHNDKYKLLQKKEEEEEEDVYELEEEEDDVEATESSVSHSDIQEIKQQKVEEINKNVDTNVHVDNNEDYDNDYVQDAPKGNKNQCMSCGIL